MLRPRLFRTLTVVAVAILSTVLTTVVPTAAASAATADRTPPTTPFIGYSEGFQCLTLIIGVNRSTDNVTSQADLRYQVFDGGASIGWITDLGQPPGPWGTLQLTNAGPNAITVQAVDAAGNRSALSKANTVTGYHGAGCTP